MRAIDCKARFNVPALLIVALVFSCVMAGTAVAMPMGDVGTMGGATPMGDSSPMDTSDPGAPRVTCDTTVAPAKQDLAKTSVASELVALPAADLRRVADRAAAVHLIPTVAPPSVGPAIVAPLRI